MFMYFFLFGLLSLLSFVLKTTYEDVFPAEATTVEEYLQQVVHSFTFMHNSERTCTNIQKERFFKSFLIIDIVIDVTQVREMAMVSAVQEAQKDNLRSFNDYMISVLEVCVWILELDPYFLLSF